MELNTLRKDELGAKHLSTADQTKFKEFLKQEKFFDIDKIQEIIDEHFINGLEIISLDLEVLKPCIKEDSEWFSKIQNKSKKFGNEMDCSVLTAVRYTLGQDIKQAERITLTREHLCNGDLNKIVEGKLVIGFNSNSFDLPLLIANGYLSKDTKFETFDLLHNIWLDLGLGIERDDYNHFSHGGVGLEKICQMYFNTKKPIKSYEETFYNYEQTGNVQELANLSYYDSLNTLTLSIIYIVASKFDFKLPPLKRSV